jgi:hypothetical protein
VFQAAALLLADAQVLVHGAEPLVVLVEAVVGGRGVVREGVGGAAEVNVTPCIGSLLSGRLESFDTSDVAGALWVLRSCDPDSRHVAHHGVFLDQLPHRPLEAMHLRRPRLRQQITDPGLALLEGDGRRARRAVVLLRAVDPGPREVHLRQSANSLWVILHVALELNQVDTLALFGRSAWSVAAKAVILALHLAITLKRRKHGSLVLLSVVVHVHFISVFNFNSRYL